MSLEPFLDKIICGDSLEVLKKIPSNSIDTIITSPPYWGLRDYGESTCKIWGGDPNCDHELEIKHIYREPSGGNISERAKIGQGYRNHKTGSCKKCGAWYGQLGLEPTLNMYLYHMLQITKELKRILKKTGVMFWNHGDSYGRKDNPNDKNLTKSLVGSKCMALQNYRLIIKMIDEQRWILRNIIIWYKPNHMPSSANDRFANSYEPVFMLVKSNKYWFDLDAVRVPYVPGGTLDKKSPVNKFASDPRNRLGRLGKRSHSELIYVKPHPLGKNPGDLWTIPTESFHEAHYAVFPTKLVEVMVKAGCPQWICRKCGNARKRIVEVKNYPDYDVLWIDCGCNAGWDSGVVLDPFLGSGTTAYVVKKLGRHYIGIDLNPEYCAMARRRLSKIPERLERFGLDFEFQSKNLKEVEKR